MWRWSGKCEKVLYDGCITWGGEGPEQKSIRNIDTGPNASTLAKVAQGLPINFICGIESCAINAMIGGAENWRMDSEVECT